MTKLLSEKVNKHTLLAAQEMAVINLDGATHINFRTN